MAKHAAIGYGIPPGVGRPPRDEERDACLHQVGGLTSHVKGVFGEFRMLASAESRYHARFATSLFSFGGFPRESIAAVAAVARVIQRKALVANFARSFLLQSRLGLEG